MALPRLARGNLRDRIGTYATLVRLPNLFTAPPDVLAGAALAATTTRVSVPATVGLAAASMALYAAGTALNDYFDADEDAVERPERPIPSGHVSRSRALALGVGLLAGGVAVAGLAAGPEGAVVASLIAVVVVAYDGWLKGGSAGFLAMGTARALNVALGATAAGALPVALGSRALAVPAVVGAYVAGVTLMADSETEGGNRAAVSVAAAGAVVAAVAVVAAAWWVATPPIAFGVAVLLAAGFLAWTGGALRRAYADPVPETVGRAVGFCVLGLVILDAGFAVAAGVAWAAVTLSFLVPAVGFARAFDVT